MKKYTVRQSAPGAETSFKTDDLNKAVEFAMAAKGDFVGVVFKNSANKCIFKFDGGKIVLDSHNKAERRKING